MVINADDFGISHEVNEAVVKGFCNGVVNRTTIMVNMPYSDEALELSEKYGFKHRVGLHVNLTQGKALTRECADSPLCNENGEFIGNFHVSIRQRFFLSKEMRKAVYCEIDAQMKKYKCMGFTLMHADSHNYVHTYPSVAASYNKLLKKHGFKSVRISRNIPKGDFSLLFGVYKTLYNSFMKGFKINGKRIRTNKYFGSVQDFEKWTSQGKACDFDDIEIMSHPKMKNARLFDDTLPCPHEFVDSQWIKNNDVTLENGIKKQLLITFIQTHVGGAMTSLVNFLNSLDTEKYDVDLLLYENTNATRWGIKESINILEPAKVHEKYSFKNILKKGINPVYVISKIKEKYYRKIKHNKKRAVQIMAKQGCKYSRRLDKHYDVAISYEFSWCMYYTAKYVDADIKMLWHHLDYHGAELDFKADKSTFDAYDRMVFVSVETMKKFVCMHPEYTDKSLFFPNLLSSEYVRKRGQEQVERVFEANDAVTDIITVARINFKHKGYDRGIEAFKRLKKEGLCKLRWIIIGSGSDSERLRELIEKNELTDRVKMLGTKLNPIPYLKQCKIMFLPSRYEGKPMAVTEALMMGLVPLVSRYASADEQIENGVDGIVTDNNTDAIYEGLLYVVNNSEKIEQMRKNIALREYGNTSQIENFDKLVNELITIKKYV